MTYWYSKAVVEAEQASDRCQKCGSKLLYHDFDPRNQHNGISCLACGYEQVLRDGSRSTMAPTKISTGKLRLRRSKWQ